MTLRHLEIFVEVAECGKMSEAAKKMYIAQSSVSQAILEIERQYNIRLFERYSKKLYLTEAGEEMLRYAQNITELYNTMDQQMRYNNRTVRIRVGATMTIGACLIGDILKEFNARHSNVNVTVMVRNTPNLERRLMSSELDIALVEGRTKERELVSRKFFTDHLSLVVGREHPFYQRDSIEISELEDQPFIFRETGSGTRIMTEEFLARHGVKVREVWMCNNSEAIKNAVINNYGISLLSELLVKRECREGLMHKLPIHNVELTQNYSLVYHKDKFFTNELTAFTQICEKFQYLR